MRVNVAKRLSTYQRHAVHFSRNTRAAGRATAFGSCRDATGETPRAARYTPSLPSSALGVTESSEPNQIFLLQPEVPLVFFFGAKKEAIHWLAFVHRLHFIASQVSLL
jgi:hypothetical protein